MDDVGKDESSTILEISEFVDAFSSFSGELETS